MSARFTSALAVSVLVWAGAALAPVPTLAGPHAGGTLILHSPEIITCFDGSGRGQTLCQVVAGAPLLDCESALTNRPGLGQSWYLAVYAAFPPTSSPRLFGVTFGISYDETDVVLVAWEGCGDFELPNNAWPASGEGTAVTWNTPQTDTLVQVYAFGAYEYYGLDVSLDLIPHPTQGSFFADDTIPSILDPVADFGRLGFNGNPGYLPCPVSGELVGACCFGTGECIETLMIDCEELGGIWLGENTICDPNPCDPTPTLTTSWGRLKTSYR